MKTIIPVLFPDIKFLNALIDIGAVAIDKNQKVKLNKPKSILELNLINRNIENLKGLEYFSNLKVLNVSNNKLKKIDLKNNCKIEILDASNNNLSKIDLRGLVKIKKLLVNNNQIRHLLLPKSKKLFYLDIRYNKIKSISLSNYPSIRVFLTAKNQIKKLDLRKNRLIYLGIDKILFKSIKLHSVRKPYEIVTNIEMQDYEKWFTQEISSQVKNVHIGRLAMWLRSLLIDYDEIKLYHRNLKGSLIISERIMSCTSLFTIPVHYINSTELINIDKNNDRYNTEVSLLKMPNTGFPLNIVIQKTDKTQEKFHIKEVYFSSVDSFGFSDLNVLLYEELTKNITKKVFILIND